MSVEYCNVTVCVYGWSSSVAFLEFCLCEFVPHNGWGGFIGVSLNFLK